MNTIKNLRPSPRGTVLSVLGLVTLGVAILSVAVSYQILEPAFGAWAVPVVGALDALWCVFQATEILAGNNRRRVWRVQAAGLTLTFVNAAIPTADLILSGPGGFDLAVVLTPVAIVFTKLAWWIALPSLGRRASAKTRQALDSKRQEVDDRLEEMEAEAAHRVELLRTATSLEKRVSKEETRYRKAHLKMQQATTEALHKQAQSTQATVTEKALPASVAAIRLPDLGTWTPTAPPLPTAPVLPAADRDAPGTDDMGSHAGQRGGVGNGDHDRHTSRDADRDRVTLEQLATVTGVPTPEPGEQLTDGQLDVVLRHLRYRDEPPLSYRQAVATFRESGYVGSEKRVRHAWGALMSKEDTTTGPTETAGADSDDVDTDDDSEDADA
ncbi:hypothetical protein ACQ9AR_33420 [Streptomyces lividans]|uniref:SpdB2-like n=2 Tax=Streptomyces lividans TaxID=1916 RepID=Q848E4_STRLI|nr:MULTISPECIES: spdB2-like [Streptomyces]AAO61170.1 spdB2-like [Streptomyces lividans 1326]ABD72311.1 pQC542.7c [Streptomyces lividans]KKD10996.1 hypothetical protein TR66_33345 [Streptomyces sp. WM6391]